MGFVKMNPYIFVQNYTNTASAAAIRVKIVTAIAGVYSIFAAAFGCVFANALLESERLNEDACAVDGNGNGMDESCFADVDDEMSGIAVDPAAVDGVQDQSAGDSAAVFGSRHIPHALISAEFLVQPALTSGTPLQSLFGYMTMLNTFVIALHVTLAPTLLPA